MKGDMVIRRQIGMAKIKKAIAEHGGSTLMCAGVTSIVAGILGWSAAQAGAKIFEISPNGIALDIGFEGLHSRPDARKISYRIPTETIAQRVAGYRAVLGDDVYITVANSGLWTYPSPCPFTDEDAYLLAAAGADGLHVHKTTIEDYAYIAEIAHRYGLLVEAYIGEPEEVILSEHFGFLGVPAATPDDVSSCVHDLEQANVDLIGLLTGKEYQGLNSGKIVPSELKRINAFLKSATHPTILEGGITPINFRAYKATGVNIIVVGTAFDQVCQKAITEAVKELLG
jgi:hypothetical protein